LNEGELTDEQRERMRKELPRLGVREGHTQTTVIDDATATTSYPPYLSELDLSNAPAPNINQVFDATPNNLGRIACLLESNEPIRLDIGALLLRGLERLDVVHALTPLDLVEVSPVDLLL
jgi:hypothetical protein